MIQRLSFPMQVIILLISVVFCWLAIADGNDRLAAADSQLTVPIGNLEKQQQRIDPFVPSGATRNQFPGVSFTTHASLSDYYLDLLKSNGARLVSMETPEIAGTPSSVLNTAIAVTYDMPYGSYIDLRRLLEDQPLLIRHQSIRVNGLQGDLVRVDESVILATIEKTAGKNGSP